MFLPSLMKWISRIAAVVTSPLMLLSCSGIDCPLDSVVVMTCRIETPGDATPFSSLDVYASVYGRDTLIVNSLTPESGTFAVSVRHAVPTDTLLLVFNLSDGRQAIDSMMIDHSNEPHFEALDCPAAMFHHLGMVRNVGDMVDSVKVVQANVTYEDVTNVKIYLRPAP